MDLDPSLFLIPPVRPGLRGHPFKVLQGPSRRLRRKSSFSIRGIIYWTRLPTPIVTAPSVNSFKRQLDPTWEELFPEVRNYPTFSPTPNTQSPFTLSPFMIVKIVLYHITLPIFGYRGPLWPALPLKINIIIIHRLLTLLSSTNLCI